MEYVAAMHDRIELALQRRLERGEVIGEEVMAAATSHAARTLRQIEAEMGVGEEQDAAGGGHS